MANTTEKEYIDLLEGDEKTKLALFACSASLFLDDDVARDAIELVADSNGSTDNLLRRVKRLGCVWQQWDGSWYIAEDVRPQLLEQFFVQVSPEKQLQLRKRLAIHASERAKRFSSDGQITAYRTRQAKFEAAYQCTLIPEQSNGGAEQFTELWQTSSHLAAQVATAEAVDYLAPELSRHLHHLPVHILFLQGMAARARKDRENQLRYFRSVWENGRYGYIFALAAHFFGNLVRDRRTGERALRDSLQWYNDPSGQSHVYHSLGNLLSKDRGRWREAEEAYRQSLKLDDDPSSQVQVYHSLGNLLSRDRSRWSEAEKAYKQSLKLRDDPSGQAQVYHSLGNLLSRDRSRWSEAEKAYEQSLKLRDNSEDKAHVLASWANLLSKFDSDDARDRTEKLALESLLLDPDNPWTSGVCHRVLADVYENRGDFGKAIEKLEALMETDRRLGKKGFEKKIQERIAALRQRDQAHR